MKELGKGYLHILPPRGEKDLRYLHLRAQQKSEYKVLGHLLKQTVRGQIQTRKQMGIKRFWVHLFVLVMHYLPLKTSNNTRLQLQQLFQCHPGSAVIQERDWHLKRFGLFHWYRPYLRNNRTLVIYQPL